MEEQIELEENQVVQEEPGYEPRPVWQRVTAWVGLAIVIAGVVLYYIHIANGGI